MKFKTFTKTLLVGGFMFFCNQAMAQTNLPQDTPEKLTKAQEIELRQKVYEEKRVARFLARQQARQAKADAKEARYQEDEAHEAAKIAERLAKLEQKEQRKLERKNARRIAAPEATVSR